MAEATMKQIRAAITANRGGLHDANDAQIRIIWEALDAETQKQYINSVKGKKDAIGDKPQGEI